MKYPLEDFKPTVNEKRGIPYDLNLKNKHELHMKLIGDFFNVLETSINEAGFSTNIKLNPEHIVYKGHFPGRPVTPGVIQLKIVHELLEDHLGKKLKLISLPQCKFLEILDPLETPHIVIEIEFAINKEFLSVKSSGKHAGILYFKLNSNYQFY